MKPKFNPVGMFFNGCEILQTVGKDRGHQTICRIRCTCGKEFETHFETMRRGTTRSCGCYRIKSCTERIKGVRRPPGPTDRLTHQSWRNMIYRCTSPKNPSYKFYGGRGISFDERWKDVKAFVEDMGHRPGKEFTLDRIDPNKNYCKENCRWATWKEQYNNKRNTKLLEWQGESLPISELAERHGLTWTQLYYRVFTAGYTLVEALNLKKRKNATTT